jgi:hypothetical protein
MMPCERKSGEPIAAVTVPEPTAAASVATAFLGEGRRPDPKVREMVLPGRLSGARSRPDHRRRELSQEGPRIQWEERGKIAVRSAVRTIARSMSRSPPNRHASLPVAYRLYLAEACACDAARRRKRRCA